MEGEESLPTVRSSLEISVKETEGQVEACAAMPDERNSLLIDSRMDIERLVSSVVNEKEADRRKEEADTLAVAVEFSSARADARKPAERLAEMELLSAQKEANEDVIRVQKEDLQHILEASESRGLDLEGRLKELEDNLASKLEELERKREEQAAYECRIRELTEALQLEERKVQDLQLTVRQREDGLVVTRRLSTDLAAQIAACDASQSDKSSLEAKVSDLETTLRKALDDSVVKSEEVVKAELRLVAERKKVYDCGNKLAESEALLARLDCEGTAKSGMVEKGMDFDSTAEALEAMQKLLTDSQKELDTKILALEVAEERGRVFEERVVQLESVLMEMSSRLRSVREEANRKDQEAADMIDRVNHSQKEITARMLALQEGEERERILGRRVIELESVLAEMSSRLRSAEQEANLKAQKSADMTDEVNRSQKEIAARMFAMEEAEERERTLERRVIEMELALAEMGSRLRSAEQKANLKAKKSADMTDEVNRSQKEIPARMFAMEEAVERESALEKRVIELESALAEKSLRLHSAEQEANLKAQKSADLTDEVNRSQKETTARMFAMEEAAERESALEKRVIELESALAEMSSRLHSAEQEVNLKAQKSADMTDEVNRSQKEITARRLAMEEAEERESALERRVIELGSALTEMSFRLRSVQEEANRREWELADLTSQERAAGMKCWKLEAALREAREEVLMLRQEILQKDIELASAREAASAAEMKSEEMERSYEGRLGDIHSVVEEVKVRLMEKMEDSDRKEKELVNTMLERETKAAAALKQAEEKVAKAEKEVFDLKKNLEIVLTESKWTRKRVLELEGVKSRFDKAERALAPLQCSVEEAAERLRGAEMSLQAALMKVEEAESRTQALDEVMRESRRSSQGAEERCKSLAAQLMVAEEKVVGFFAMKLRAEEAETKVSQLMEFRERMEDKAAALEGALHQVEAALRLSQAEGEQVKKRAEELVTSLSGAEARVFELESRELSLSEMVERERVRAEEAEKEAEARLVELERSMEVKLSSLGEGAWYAKRQVDNMETTRRGGGVSTRKTNGEHDGLVGGEESGGHRKDGGWIIVDTDGGDNDGKDDVVSLQEWRARSDHDRKQILALEEQVHTMEEASKQAASEALHWQETEASLRAQVAELQQKLENDRVAGKGEVSADREKEKKTFRDVTIEGEITSLKAKAAESEVLRVRTTELEQKLKDSEIREQRQHMAITMWEGRVSAAEGKLREYEQQMTRSSKADGDLAEALLHAAEKVQKAEAEAGAARDAERQAKATAAALQETVKSLDGKLKGASVERGKTRGKKESNKEARKADAEIHRGGSEAANVESASVAVRGKIVAAAESQASVSSTRRKKSKVFTQLEDSATSAPSKAAEVVSRAMVGGARSRRTVILKSMLTHVLIAALALGVGYVLSPVVKQ